MGASIRDFFQETMANLFISRLGLENVLGRLKQKHKYFFREKYNKFLQGMILFCFGFSLKLTPAKGIDW